MERSPIITTLFHIRMICLTSLLACLDMYFIASAYNYTLAKGATVQLVFGVEVSYSKERERESLIYF
jgi:hypothetical protein